MTVATAVAVAPSSNPCVRRGQGLRSPRLGRFHRAESEGPRLGDGSAASGSRGGLPRPHGRALVAPHSQGTRSTAWSRWRGFWRRHVEWAGTGSARAGSPRSSSGCRRRRSAGRPPCVQSRLLSAPPAVCPSTHSREGPYGLLRAFVLFRHEGSSGTVPCARWRSSEEFRRSAPRLNAAQRVLPFMVWVCAARQ